MPGIIPVNGKYALMFHYVKDAETARVISESGVLKPTTPDVNSLQQYIGDPRLLMSRINLTDVRPEEGRDKIARDTYLQRYEINFGLEVLVKKDGLSQAFPYLPRAYQIFSKEPVPVKVLRVHNMDRLEARLRMGQTIERFFGYNNGLPYARYASATR